MKEKGEKQKGRKRSKTFKSITWEGEDIVINPNPCKIIDGEIYWSDIN